tara:strand:- start:367 stop:660 length:294 start_codon:yes stop_codon:yes gene_type:complete
MILFNFGTCILRNSISYKRLDFKTSHLASLIEQDMQHVFPQDNSLPESATDTSFVTHTTNPYDNDYDDDMVKQTKMERLISQRPQPNMIQQNSDAVL